MQESNVVSGRKPELNLSRVFDAPRALVFEAWSSAEHVSRWFTPRPLTTAQCTLDFRAGGAFRLVMRMPNGQEHPMDAVFHEIVPNERIVFVGTIAENQRIETTVTFSEEAGGKTKLSVRQTYSFESDATRGAPQGWAATLDQLAEHVSRAKASAAH